MKNNSSPVLPTTAPRNYNSANGSKNWCDKCDGTYATLAALISHKKSCKGTVNLRRQLQQEPPKEINIESKRLLIQSLLDRSMTENGDEGGDDDEDNDESLSHHNSANNIDEQSLKLMSEAMGMSNPFGHLANPLMQWAGNEMLPMPPFGAFPPNDFGAFLESLAPLLASVNVERGDTSSPSPEEQQAAMLTQQMMFFHMLQQLQGGPPQIPPLPFLAAAAAAAAAQQQSQSSPVTSSPEKMTPESTLEMNKNESNIKEVFDFHISQLSNRHSQIDNLKLNEDKFSIELEDLKRPQSASSTSTSVSNSQPSTTQKLMSSILDLKDTNPDAPLPPMMSPPKVDPNDAVSFNEPNTLELLQKHTEQALQNTMSGGSFLLNGLSSADSNDILNFRKGKDGKEDPACRHRCKFCGKVFGSDSALQIHIRSHTGERPFKCNICGNRFTTKGNLKVHFQRHKAKYPHVKMNPHPVPEHLDKFHPPLEPPSNSQSPPPPPLASYNSSTPNANTMHIPAIFSSTLIPFASEGSPKEANKFLNNELNKSKNRNFFDFPSLYKSTLQLKSTEANLHNHLTDTSDESDGEESQGAFSQNEDDSDGSDPDMNRTEEAINLRKLSEANNDKEEPIDNFEDSNDKSPRMSIEDPNKERQEEEGPNEDNASGNESFCGDYGMNLKAKDRFVDNVDQNGQTESDGDLGEEGDTNSTPFPFNVHLPYFPSLPGSSNGHMQTSFNFMGLPFGALGSNSLPDSVSLSMQSAGMRQGSESEMAEAASKDPIFYQNLLPKPGSTDNAWESLMEVQKAPDAVKLQFEKMDNKVNDPNECIICNRVLSCKSALQMHYRTHTGERTFKCKICSRAFTTKGNLKTHMGVHRVKPPLRMLHQCPICHKQFTNALVLQQHLRLHAGESGVSFVNDFAIDLAKFKNNPLLPPNFAAAFMPPFGSPFPMLGSGGGGLFGHSMMPSELSPQQLVKSPSMSSLPIQLGKEFDEDSKSNLDDERSTEIKNEFDDFQETEKRNKTLSESSEKRTLSDSASETTEIEEEQESPNKKKKIDAENSQNEESGDEKSEKREDALSALANHVMKSTSQSNILYNGGSATTTPEKALLDNNSKANSDTSSNKSSSMLDYRVYPVAPFEGMPYHPTGRPNTTCRICNKTFACFSALEIHYRSHTKERPFKCEVCDRGFSTKGNMKQHMLTHKIRDLPSDLYTQVSPSSNTTLGNFLTSNHIAKLMGKHTSNNDSTNNSNNSSRVSSPPTPNGNNSNSVDSTDHKLRNTESPTGDQSSTSSRTSGSNKHLCNLCNKPFSSGSALQIHMRTHTGDKPFKCSICGRAFTTKGNLKVHMGTHMWNNSPSRRGRRMSIDFSNIAPHLLGNNGNPDSNPLTVQQMMLMEIMSKQSSDMSNLSKPEDVNSTYDDENSITAGSESSINRNKRLLYEQDIDLPEDEPQIEVNSAHSESQHFNDEDDDEMNKSCKSDNSNAMSPTDANSKWNSRKQIHVCSFCRYECETDVDFEKHLKEHLSNAVSLPSQANENPTQSISNIASISL